MKESKLEKFIERFKHDLRSTRKDDFIFGVKLGGAMLMGLGAIAAEGEILNEESAKYIFGTGIGIGISSIVGPLVCYSMDRIREKFKYYLKGEKPERNPRGYFQEIYLEKEELEDPIWDTNGIIRYGNGDRWRN